MRRGMMTCTVLAANMATTQRGEKAPSARITDHETGDVGLTSSEDEAPEEVTFEDSRARALRSMKQALDAARREKELLKEKRRRRQELFQEQKKRKLLPADVLEEIDSAPSKTQKPSEDEDTPAGEEGEDESRKKSRKLAHSRNVNGNYTVTTVKGQSAASVQQQAAEDFVRSRLYGPGSCRTTSNELLSLQNKKGRNKSAAVQFVKKDWACQEKAKAEKMKKRWIHKQQIPSR